MLKHKNVSHVYSCLFNKIIKNKNYFSKRLALENSEEGNENWVYFGSKEVDIAEHLCL